MALVNLFDVWAERHGDSAQLWVLQGALEIVREHAGNRYPLYAFFKENLQHLNEDFAQLLQVWATEAAQTA